MKTIYLIKKDPAKDAEDNWRQLEAPEFFAFLKTGASRGRFFIRLPGQTEGDVNYVLETDKDSFDLYEKERQKSLYRLRRNGKESKAKETYECVYADPETIESVPDPDVDVPGAVLRKEQEEILRYSLWRLPPKDYLILWHLYLCERPKTVRQTAAELGVSVGTVCLRRDRALAFLRENLG